MRRRAGDVLGVKAFVEIDRGVYALHDLGRAAGEAAAPQGIGGAGGGSGTFGMGHAMKLPMRLRGAVILALILCLPAAGWAALTLKHRLVADDGAPPALQQFIPANPPRPAPEIGFSDGEGKRLTLADFRGRVVLINLWATWCQPCIREMP